MLTMYRHFRLSLFHFLAVATHLSATYLIDFPSLARQEHSIVKYHQSA